MYRTNGVIPGTLYQTAYNQFLGNLFGLTEFKVIGKFEWFDFKAFQNLDEKNFIITLTCIKSFQKMIIQLFQ